ncbi:hypothetical protein DPMN_051925 [Dreissena polymorpha]|uniref:Uncharacterized protein n=1 Tax=Dreissena polymorpha TaxID=45954 RepID=A0A9D4HNT7_DREPO|nr:hypothetical protein DPMN_051925 [Dreissena polymorpha]
MNDRNLNTSTTTGSRRFSEARATLFPFFSTFSWLAKYASRAGYCCKKRSTQVWRDSQRIEQNLTSLYVSVSVNSRTSWSAWRRLELF